MFQEMTMNEMMEVNGGDFYDSAMKVAKVAFVAGAGAVCAVVGGAIGGAVTGGNPVDVGVGVVAGGVAVEKVWNDLFD